MATKQPRDKWPSGAGAASGGHVTPDFSTDEAFLDALKQPEDEEAIELTRRARREAARKGRATTTPAGSRDPEPTGSAPRSYSGEPPLRARSEFDATPVPSTTDGPLGAPSAFEPRSQGRARRQVTPRPRASLRRVKRTLKHVDPLSVLKLSLFYYAVFLIVWLGIVAVIYSLLSTMGAFDTIEEIGRVFTLWDRIDITLFVVERWAFLIGLTLVVLASLINLCLAFLYNLGADLVGGVEVTFVERDV